MNPYPEKALGEFLTLDVATEPVNLDRTYVTAGIYSYGRGLFKRPAISGSETRYSRYTRLREGQFVFSRLFGWEGALATVTPEFDNLYVSSEFPTFRIDETVADRRYVSHLARWSGLHDKLRDKGTGMGSRRQRVNIDRLLAATAPMPELNEQRRVATHLDSAFERLGRVEVLCNYRSRLDMALRDSVMERAITESAVSVRIGSILVASRILVNIDPDKSYRALGMRSFGKGTIRYESVKGRELSKLRYFCFPSGVLALSNIKAWEGAVGITDAEDSKCVASNRFLFYSPRDESINLSYLRHYFLSRRGLSQISACSPGSADRNRTLSIKKFENLRVPLPARGEQDKLAKMFDALDARVKVSKTQELQTALRASLLNAAFSGQL